MPDRLFYFSGSAERPPGEGAHEQVADPARYALLAATPGWRRMLSNFWVAPFAFRDATWRTVEHAFQAAKIARVDPAAARRFTVESGDPLGLGDGLAARKARKLVILDAAALAAWDAEKHGIMREALRAKFAAHPELRAVLRGTFDAELWHAGARERPQRIHDLEAVRAELPGG